MRGDPNTVDGHRIPPQPHAKDACAYCGAMEPVAILTRLNTTEWLCEECGA
jgi:ribosomal protein L37AE/L43A